MYDDKILFRADGGKIMTRDIVLLVINNLSIRCKLYRDCPTERKTRQLVPFVVDVKNLSDILTCNHNEY